MIETTKDNIYKKE